MTDAAAHVTVEEKVILVGGKFESLPLGCKYPEPEDYFENVSIIVKFHVQRGVPSHGFPSETSLCLRAGESGRCACGN